MLPQLAVFAVHGDEVLGPQQHVHELQLLLTGVAGYVHIGVAFVDNRRTFVMQHIDYIRHPALVARDWCGRNDNGVAFLNLVITSYSIHYTKLYEY